MVLFFIIMASVTYLTFSIRHYTKNDTEYKLDFMRKLPGVQNLSSLTLHREQGHLYATQNKPATLLKISAEGDILQSVPLPFITDAETIEYIDDNIFAAVDESSSELFFFTVTADMAIILHNAIQLSSFKKKNRGFEGLAWNRDEHILYAAKERKPHGIFTWHLSPDSGSIKSIQLPDFPYRVDVDDISALDYSSGKLLVLSDESRVLLETVAGATTYTEVLRLTRGYHGLTEDIPQPEGVVRTPDGSIWIASEPDLLVRFRPAESGQ
ncbi:esterase-like activity of phytase [Escherichia coli]|nr:esterase-like activity of phytase [Escherichia coli]